MDTEGIYRVSGNKQDIESVLTKFDAGKTFALLPSDDSLTFREGYANTSPIFRLTSKAAFTLYRITFDLIEKCSFSLAFTLYRITFDPIEKCSFSLAFTLYRITFDPLEKFSFSLAFTLYRYKMQFRSSAGANCSSFLAGTKLYRILM